MASYSFYDPMDPATTVNSAVAAMQVSVDLQVLNADSLAQGLVLKQRFVDSTFHGKRQSPITYTAGGVSQQWEATDEAVNALTSQLGALTSQELTSTENSTTSTLVNSINSALGALANDTNNGVNNGFTNISSQQETTKTQANAGIFIAGINPPLHAITVSYTPAQSIHVVAQTVSAGTISSPPISWLPINSATPVTITRSEATGLIGAIAARRANLMGTRMTLRLALASDPTLEAVAARDVHSMWAY